MKKIFEYLTGYTIVKKAENVEHFRERVWIEIYNIKLQNIDNPIEWKWWTKFDLWLKNFK